MHEALYSTVELPITCGNEPAVKHYDILRTKVVLRINVCSKRSGVRLADWALVDRLPSLHQANLREKK